MMQARLAFVGPGVTDACKSVGHRKLNKPPRGGLFHSAIRGTFSAARRAPCKMGVDCLCQGSTPRAFIRGLPALIIQESDSSCRK